MSTGPRRDGPAAGVGEGSAWPGPPGESVAAGPASPGPSPPAPAIVVVLVEPAGPLNVGSVARLCANFAISQLRLVAPRCNPLGEEARRMAVHGQAQLEQAATYPDLAAAIADCRRVVATSGRLEREELPVEGPESALRWLIAPEEGQARQGALASSGAGAAPVALVFGREDRGLSNDELLQAGRILRLESSADYASLNLSHAVAICLHDLRRLPGPAAPVAPPSLAGPPFPQQDPSQGQAQGHPPHQLPALPSAQSPSQAEGRAPLPCPGDGGPDAPTVTACQQIAPGAPPAGQEGAATSLRGALEATLADAEDLLLAVGFLHPHTAHARMAKLRGLLQRAQIREGEVALLRGMVRQLRWASTRRTP